MKISENTKESLVLATLSKAISYKEYRDLVAAHAAAETSTGDTQSEALSEYTQLNNARMRRLDKTLKPAEAVLERFQNFESKQTWLVLSESWCGDAAQNLPVINKIALENSNINLQLVLRDDNEELMDLFLTNGGKSIPKLIALDSENNVIDIN